VDRRVDRVQRHDGISGLEKGSCRHLALSGKPMTALLLPNPIIPSVSLALFVGSMLSGARQGSQDCQSSVKVLALTPEQPAGHGRQGEAEGGASVLFTGGAIPLNGTGRLRMGLRDLSSAMADADSEARTGGHPWDARCGTWATAME
jgi:hypothetical protein